MKYKRILLKLSGEALAGKDGQGLDHKILEQYSQEIKQVSEEGVEVAIVIGGGNIMRGSDAEEIGIDRFREIIWVCSQLLSMEWRSKVPLKKSESIPGF